MRRGDYINNFFDNDFLAPVSLNSNSFKVNIKEDKNEYVMEAALPGIQKDAINLEYTNNYLTVSAKRQDKIDIH